MLRLDDRPFIFCRLITHGDPANTVIHRTRNAGGSDRIKWVHRRNQTKALLCLNPPEPRHVHLPLAHHGDKSIQSFLWHAIDLFDVQQ